MRQIIIDLIAALSGIAVAGLVLHNPEATKTVTAGTLGAYSNALSGAASTR